MARPSRRDQLLDAASAVLRRDGPLALTLDATAAEAGVSKGGVLYHFPEKERLVVALVERVIARFEGAVEGAVAVDPAPQGAFTRAYLRATIAALPDDAAVMPLLVAFAGSPAVVEPWRRAVERWQRRSAADGLPAGEAEGLRLAVDGWWLAALVGAPPAVDALTAWIDARSGR